MTELAVGEEVTIISIYYGIQRVVGVRRIMKRFVELEDESQWNENGLPYPHQQWSRSHIRRTRPGDHQEAYVKMMRFRIDRWVANWKEHPPDEETLIRVSDAIRGITRRPRPKRKEDDVG